MTAIATSPLITLQEFEAMPEDPTIDRWLVRGQMRERAIAKRNRWLSRTMIRIGFLLEQWFEAHADIGGEVSGGEAGFILSDDPVSVVGIDVADVAAIFTGESTRHEGPPVLAVEILSRNDRQGDLQEKITEYWRCSVKSVWVVDPRFQTVTVFRPDAEPELFNRWHTIAAEPHLPGFSTTVERIFG